MRRSLRLLYHLGKYLRLDSPQAREAPTPPTQNDFRNPKIFFFRGNLLRSSRRQKNGKPQQIPCQYQPIPAIATFQSQHEQVFFPGSLCSSYKRRKKGNSSISPSNFTKMIFPNQKSFFSGQSAKQKKHSPIPARTL